MSNERQLKIVEDHITDAKVRGAQVLTGGKRLSEGEGWFHEPTVLINVDHSMKLMRDETFGPVLPIMTFKSEDEAVRLANDSIYGLTASVWTNNLGRGERVAQKIQAGTVMVNEVVYTHAIAQTPWGGVKQSGYGRTHGRLGLLELVTPQHIHVNRMELTPRLRQSYLPHLPREGRGKWEIRKWDAIHLSSAACGRGNRANSMNNPATFQSQSSLGETI